MLPSGDEKRPPNGRLETSLVHNARLHSAVHGPDHYEEDGDDERSGLTLRIGTAANGRGSQQAWHMACAVECRAVGMEGAGDE